MTDDSTVGQFSLKRQFPALRLLEVPGMALSPGAIVIGGLTTLLVNLLGRVVDFILPVANSYVFSGGFPAGWRNFLGLSNTEGSLQADSVTGPISTLVLQVARILSPSAEMVLRVNALAKFTLLLALWSLIGGFLCRRSAYRFGGDDDQPDVSMARYITRRWLATFGSPLIPLSTALLLALIIASMGFVAQLPYLGSIWLFVSSPVILIFGSAMAFLLLATALCWPLMVAAIAVDDCESFGGLSRAYSGLTGRPWHLIGYVCGSFVQGQALMILVTAFEGVAIWCVLTSLEFSSGSDFVQKSESLHYPLKSLVYFLSTGIGTSYFWSAATMIYLLIRLEIDGVPLERIAADDAERPVREPLPVVGIPATDALVESNGSASPGKPTDVI